MRLWCQRFWVFVWVAAAVQLLIDTYRLVGTGQDILLGAVMLLGLLVLDKIDVEARRLRRMERRAAAPHATEPRKATEAP